jgi:hypothetical protein
MTKTDNSTKNIGGIALGFCWLVLVFAGMAVSFSESWFPRPAGWTMLGMAAGIAFFTTHVWIRALPGILAVGVLGSIVTLASGHVINHPEVKVGPVAGATLVTFFIVSCVASLRFATRSPNFLDRVVLLLFVSCFFLQAAFPSYSVPISLTGSAVLVVYAFGTKKGRVARASPD